MTRAGSRQNLRVLDALLSDTLGFRSKSVTINACVLMTPAGNEIEVASRVPVAIALKGSGSARSCKPRRRLRETPRSIDLWGEWAACVETNRKALKQQLAATN